MPSPAEPATPTPAEPATPTPAPETPKPTPKTPRAPLAPPGWFEIPLRTAGQRLVLQASQMRLVRSIGGPGTYVEDVRGGEHYTTWPIDRVLEAIRACLLP